MNRVRNGLRYAAGPILLTATVVAAAWVGYLLLDNANRPLTLGSFVLFAALVILDRVVIHAQQHATGEHALRADDTADQALTAAQDAKVAAEDALALARRIAGIPDQPTGRHAATRRETADQ